MRFICKTSQPDSFTEWKGRGNQDWQPNWNNFQKPEKLAVHEALLKDQGYTCCYCGQRITLTNSHIEHLRPKKNYPELSLEYSNLLSSCPGYTEDPNRQPNVTRRPQEFCGPKKDDWYDLKLTVSPLMPDCAEYFRYTALGEIMTAESPDKQAAAKETIEKLGLNHSKLRISREKAIEGILDDIEQLQSEEIQRLIDAYDQPNQDHELIPFCAAITYILKSFI